MKTGIFNFTINSQLGIKWKFKLIVNTIEDKAPHSPLTYYHITNQIPTLICGKFILLTSSNLIYYLSLIKAKFITHNIGNIANNHSWIDYLSKVF